MYRCMLLVSDQFSLLNWIVPIQISRSLQNVHTAQKNIDSSLYCIFHIHIFYQAIERVIIAVPLNVNSLSFCPDYILNPEFFLACLFQLKSFPVEIVNNTPVHATILFTFSTTKIQTNLVCNFCRSLMSF